MSQVTHQARARGPIGGSHLRQVSTGSSEIVENDAATSSEEDLAPEQTQKSQDPEMPNRASLKRLCILSVHDEATSRDDVLVNMTLFNVGDLHLGDLMQLTALRGNSTTNDGHITAETDKAKPQGVKEQAGNAQELPSNFGEENLDSNKHHVFTLKRMTQEMLAKQPSQQISISQRIALASSFDKGNLVLLSTADDLSCNASHVEIVFRDQYLARADMWRLIISELVDTCIYRGQRIVFLGSIKAVVKTIFVRGRKVQSAFFQKSSKPIFRSESARYVLFIQMSKEMWDFDAESTGEIMFDKVINGFLPELFKRWQQLKVKHLVSIVLFTRMIYEERVPTGTVDPEADSESSRNQSGDGHTSAKDFYRVVVSDMASGEWAGILNLLKKEFKVFRRDISIRKPGPGDHLPLGSGLSSALADPPSYVIAGHPSAATCGNVLEAINLASSQFSTDYIDRDLVRTGVSIVVISPSAGLFEVDYNLLVATTDNLIDNGVGIDLVCLSRMPLHSVPLFKYRRLRSGPENANLPTDRLLDRDGETPIGSVSADKEHGTSPTVNSSGDVPQRGSKVSGGSSDQQWSYGIPHWVDISFWSSSLDGNHKNIAKSQKPKNKLNSDTSRHKPFNPRVRMYELQMMGVMENAISDISIPPLSQTLRTSPKLIHSPTTTAMSKSPKTADIHLTSESFGSPSDRSGGHTPKLSTSLVSSRTGDSRSRGPLTQWMDEYDDQLFRHPRAKKRQNRKARSTKRPSRSGFQGETSPFSRGSSTGDSKTSSASHRHSPTSESYLGKVMQRRRSSRPKISKKPSVVSTTASTQSNQSKLGTISRQISFGPRGFGVAAPNASTELSVHHENPPSLLSHGLKSKLPPTNVSRSSATPTKPQLSSTSLSSAKSQHATIGNQDPTQSSDSESQETSRPIPIRNTTAIRITDKAKEGARTTTRGHLEHLAGVVLQDRLAALQDLGEENQNTATREHGDLDDVRLPPTILSPSTTLAPWLTILNPSNPSKVKTILASRLGRWQHLFPRPLRTSQIKWKSLCSPAAVPLTTEDFPSADQLTEEYQESSYQIHLPEDRDLPENPRSLVTEMLAFRLSRGFQVVVGSKLIESAKVPLLQKLNVFDQRILAETGATIFLTRGSTIHKVTRLDEGSVEVKQLIRHSVVTSKHAEAESMLYKPSIRSMLADTYDAKEISIAPQRGNFDWQTIDSFVLGHERPKAEDFVGSLRPWRARFVLIPVDAPSNPRRSLQPMNEDDEEEVRLEGIRKLTQLWQRFRFVPPEERRFQAPVRNRKDTNPLDILYQTRNPSAIVAAELENVAEGDATGRPVQLLPESDLYQRANLNVASLAETIQSEKGVRMLDRRWHWRLHYNCFIGFELTTWLLQNFRDVDTRDEAVELGNELMKSGMFQHVEQRHNFRDGNYFYQIAGEYRAPRPESRGWFGRGKLSVPSTPVSEDMSQELPKTGRSRASSSTNSDPSIPTGNRQKLGVALSKSLLYDVDHRKRSYRPELINLHYDRLHNPDNCYHIRVEWMNTTPKLIQDAVLSWATSVDRFGLRLVEVPLGEASSINSMHPFRAPFLVKLAQTPPGKQPQSYFDAASFTPQPKADKHFYQKAIMKKFNFVLDFEAASDFPQDVDVTYSWGRPDYRYPQYIHRSGVLIAQITDDGDILLLANRLYNNRSAANSSYQDNYRADASDSGQERGLGFFRSSPQRGTGDTHRSPSRSSPFSSPSARATLDILSDSSATPRGPSPTTSAPNPPGFARSGAATAFATPEAITKDVQTFCNDKEALENFYTYVFSKSSSPGPNTPFMASKTPYKGPDAAVMESSIPALALPGSLLSRGGKRESAEKKPELKTRTVGAESPSYRRQKKEGLGINW
ncbi:GATOR complex protein depdc5 [Mycoblastus sanguinarius]|nr:GATOR complex protein depdc5 [Mycoblastus sanguinarius]